MPVRRRGPGPEDAARKLRRFIERAEAGAEVALQGAAVTLENQIKAELSTPGRGRIRRKSTERVGRGSYNWVYVTGPDGKRKRVRRMVRQGAPRVNIAGADRASAPGDPPAPDIGTLRGSVTHERLPDEHETRDGKPVRVMKFAVGVLAEYAEALEYGAVGAGRNRSVTIAPRPFMRPALAKVEDQMGAEVIATLKRAAESE